MTGERWRQLEELYHAARMRNPAERAVLLESTDPELRSRVEHMLAVDSTGQILDRPPPDLIIGAETGTPVDAGVEFGPYRIEAPVGSGGMGAVYRATDTRLGRVVAIKIAAARYSERFQLEAQAISTLNHPHVCTLYDVGPDYLVMEFIEGPTLAEELRKGPLAPELAARYGAQIASALAEAHARGIVHCDLKPANIMLTRHGVKVLDFGLAKMLSESGESEPRAAMGTPAYMAPEQAEGREPDSLTDLFSLGLVLYEMASGKRPFVGERAGVPRGLDGLITKLLEKDPAARPQSAAEVAAELAALADPAHAASVPPRIKRFTWYIAAAVCAVLAIAAAVIYSSLRIRPAAVKYTQLTDFTDSAVAPTLSPDGRMVAFIRGGDPFLTADQIYVKMLPDGETRRLTDDRRLKYSVAFSPDGSRVAYTAMDAPDWNTYTVSVQGGDSRLLLHNAAGLGWLDNQQLLFSQIRTGMHLGVVTGTVTRNHFHELYFPAHERGMAHYSWASPDRKSALVMEMDGQGNWVQCRLISLDGRTQSEPTGPPGVCTAAGWSPDGSWMYFTANVEGRSHLWRQRFPNGRPEQITSGPTEEDGVAVDPDGRSVITSLGVQESAIWIHDPSGERQLSSEGEVVANFPPPMFRADEQVLYYLLRRRSTGSGAELWRTTVASGDSEPVFPGVAMLDYDVSGDGRQVVYTTNGPGGKSQMWLASAERRSPAKRIGNSDERRPYFGAPGKVLFLRAEGRFNYLEEMNVDGSGRRKVAPYPVNELQGISPGRRWVTAVVPLGHDVGLMAIPAAGGVPVRLCSGMCTPVWSSNGKYLFLELEASSRTAQGRSLAIPVRPEESLQNLPPGGVRPLPDTGMLPGAQWMNHVDFIPGRDPSHFAYVNATVHRNLYRISLPGLSSH